MKVQTTQQLSPLLQSLSLLGQFSILWVFSLQKIIREQPSKDQISILKLQAQIQIEQDKKICSY